MKKIRKAILPVAGFGTRFLPATKAQPKEMLSIFDTPAIEFVVREAVEAGIEEIILITGKGKRSLEDHFDTNFELEYKLEQSAKTHALEMVRNISSLARFAYVRQPKPLGDGHAILCAKDLIGEDESVVVLFGDDLVDNPQGPNAVQQLLNVYEKTQDPVVLLQDIPREETKKYGIVELEKNTITNVVEKPEPAVAPSTCAVVGKFIITPAIWNILRAAESGYTDGEIRLTDALQKYIKNGGSLRGHILEGKRFDTGDKIGFLDATLHYALKKEPDAVRDVLQKYYKESKNIGEDTSVR